MSVSRLTLTDTAHEGTPEGTPTPDARLRCLIVGGGPDRSDNQIAIEDNVRYVRSILPTGTPVLVLYADGTRLRHIVKYEDSTGRERYQRPYLPQIDGPATAETVNESVRKLNDASSPVLLYFTGHGSPDPLGNYVNNSYCLWGNDDLTVSELSFDLKAIDPHTPITLVMVQCFSGGFAPVLFQGSTPDHPDVRPDSCGFFASNSHLEAAGCTSEVNEADYHDFTTYFFGALSGHDRVGRAITGVDYGHEGRVGMDDAYAYTLINDTSIDTPVATSDDYVRKYTHLADSAVFATSYATVYAQATAPQRAALDGLSNVLKLTGDTRLQQAYSVFLKRAAVDEDSETVEEEEATARWIRFVRLCKTIVLENDIQAHGSAEIKAGLQSLLIAEHGNPLTDATISQTGAGEEQPPVPTPSTSPATAPLPPSPAP